MKIVLLATYQYEWAVRPFAALFAKCWGKETVIWYGDRHAGPLPDNVQFRQVPCFGEGEWPWDHHFGRGLLSILCDVEDDIIALFLPDHWLTGPVDVRKVRDLAHYMGKEGNILRGNLTVGTALDAHGVPYAKYRGLDIITTSPTDPHASLDGGLTFCPSLWNVELLGRMIEPHWRLWDCEILGTRTMARHHWPGIVSVGTRPALLQRAHGMSQHVPMKVNLTGLCREDADIVRKYLPEGWGEM